MQRGQRPVSGTSSDRTARLKAGLQPRGRPVRSPAFRRASRTLTPSASRPGFTVTELVVLVIIVAVLAGTLLPAIARYREESRRIRCRNNLNQLAKGMATYLNEHADGGVYPCPLGRTRNPNIYSGSEWLAALYWTGVIPDPGVYLCPSSRDTNRDGVDIGTRLQAATFGSQTVSYAGMHYYSDKTEAGAIFRDDPRDGPMGSDDTQGDVNHDGGMAILFFDSHVEWRTTAEIDVERAVGQRGGLLEALSN